MVIMDDDKPWTLFPDLPEQIDIGYIQKCRQIYEQHAEKYPNVDDDPYKALEKRIRICSLLQHMRAEEPIRALLRLRGNDKPVDADLPLSENHAREFIRNEEQSSKFCTLQMRLFRKFNHDEQVCFERNELPFKEIRHLGDGTYANVKEVRNVHDGRLYACKRPKGSNNNPMKRELQHLKSLKPHHHLVCFRGSFIESGQVCILLYPAANTNLDLYLQETDVTARMKKSLRKLFGCLSAGLAFLNKSGIRHKDIKPKNILVEDDNFRFTDFGSAYNFSKADKGSATSNTSPGAITLSYAAPEAHVRGGTRDIKTDLFSLGCIFAEVLAFLSGMPVRSLRQLLECPGGSTMYGKNVQKLHKWLQELEAGHHEKLDLPIKWCKQMTQEDLTDRPTIHDLISGMMQSLSSEKEMGVYFCKKCIEAHPTLAPLHTTLDENCSLSKTTECSETPQNDYGIPSLSIAAMKGDKERVGQLLESGADVDTTDPNEGATALHYACSQGNRSIVHLLLQKQANPDEVDPFVGSALSWAAQGGRKDIVQLLLDQGADITVSSEFGRTALHQAAQKGHKDVVELLLENGAAMTKDSQGRTPLHQAARHGQLEVVKLLVAGRVDMIDRDSNGCTAAELAARWGYKEVAGYIQGVIEASPNIGKQALAVRRKSKSGKKAVKFKEGDELTRTGTVL